MKDATNIYRCDNLKFTTLDANARLHLIFDNHVTSEEELGEASFKYLQDNCITWSAIEYLNTLLSSFSIRCTGIGVDAVSEFVWENWEIYGANLGVSIISVSEGRPQNSIKPQNIKVLIEEVPQNETTPGLYFTPTGATYIFTEG